MKFDDELRSERIDLWLLATPEPIGCTQEVLLQDSTDRLALPDPMPTDLSQMPAGPWSTRHALDLQKLRPASISANSSPHEFDASNNSIKLKTFAIAIEGFLNSRENQIAAAVPLILNSDQILRAARVPILKEYPQNSSQSAEA
jgi:hypothetical protein